jgi:hypothetical protein
MSAAHVLPLVRAVLSWQVVPDPNSPDQKPIWGDVQLRRSCGSPVIGRVRAVLSWGTPPSTTDPDAHPPYS